MGSSPKNEVNKKQVQKWMVQLTYKANGHRYGGQVIVDAPTEALILAALYKKYPYYHDIEIIEITNKSITYSYE